LSKRLRQEVGMPICLVLQRSTHDNYPRQLEWLIQLLEEFTKN